MHYLHLKLLNVIHSEKKGYQNGAPGVLLLQMVPFFQRGTLFSLITVPLGHWGTEIVPLRVPYYGQSNSAPRGTISVPFFFWVLGNWNAHLEVFAWNYRSKKWKPAQHEHFTVIRISKSFAGSNPSAAGSGIYSTPWAFQNVLCHFSSSIRTWVIGQNVTDMGSLEF